MGRARIEHGENAAWGLALAQGRTERIVLGVWVTVLIVGVPLLAVLWSGTVFVQGYFYTEASTAIFWQAPVAAVVLTLFYSLWCLLDYNAPGARRGYLPYDTIFRFSAEETKGTKPVPRLVAIKKSGEKIRYKRHTVFEGGRTTYRYYQEFADGSKGLPWSGSGVVALLVPEDNEEVRYEPAKSDEGTYPRFVSPDGWTMMVYDDGPTGEPVKFLTGLWLVNLLLNFGHLALWFLCLWLLLRFQWGHALGLGFVMWLVMTLVLPVMLDRAGDAAQESRRTQRQTSAHHESPRVATRGLDTASLPS
jgi:hypothetical protein